MDPDPIAILLLLLVRAVYGVHTTYFLLQPTGAS